MKGLDYVANYDVNDFHMLGITVKHNVRCRLVDTDIEVIISAKVYNRMLNGSVQGLIRPVKDKPYSQFLTLIFEK